MKQFFDVKDVIIGPVTTVPNNNMVEIRVKAGPQWEAVCFFSTDREPLEKLVQGRQPIG